MRYVWPIVALLGCGTSPEYLDEPEWPEVVDEEAAERAAPQNGHELASRPGNAGEWPCDGSTGFTRMKGRLGRGVGVEGFAERNCNGRPRK